ncbi:MAG: GNAT family N-acetyltransferase [Bacteroidia bacterium]
MEKTFKYSLEGEESERLIFRKITQNDFETWLIFCQDFDSLKYIFSQEQLLIEDPVERCKVWFDRLNNRYENGTGGMNALIDKKTGEFVGQCGLLIQTIDEKEELEIGYALMPNHRGKGYATEAAIKCKEFAFENNFSKSIISVIDPKNIASIKVALKNGMLLEKTTESKGDIVNIYRVEK